LAGDVENCLRRRHWVDQKAKLWITGPRRIFPGRIFLTTRICGIAGDVNDDPWSDRAMYIPPHFDEPRPEILYELIARNPLGMLVTHGSGGLDANHIPFHLDRGGGDPGVLACHVARANPVWQDVTTGDEVLVVFRAADAYVSPNWYPSKQDHHRQVPTWNYLVAHVHGRITVRDEEAFVRRNVAHLTRTHEASQPAPWKMGDAPRDYTDAMVKAIVGLEIQITRLEGKAKLSQNKEVRDIRSAGRTLQARGSPVVGAAMCVAADAKEQEAQ
jgi:transcriptional regulator